MKWSIIHPWLALVTSSGELCIYKLQNECLTLIVSQIVEKKPVILSLEWQDSNLVTSDSSGSITIWKFNPGMYGIDSLYEKLTIRERPLELLEASSDSFLVKCTFH